MAVNKKKPRGREAVVQNSVSIPMKGLVGRENADERVSINRSMGKRTPAGPAWMVAALSQPANSRNSTKDAPAKKSIGQAVRSAAAKAMSPKKRGK